MVRRVGAGVAGGALVVVGVALLVLPGPGFLVIAAGLAILGTQFSWARKPLRYARVKANQGVDQVARSTWYAAFTAVSGLVLVAVGVAGIAGVDVPFLTVASGIVLVLSGLFLIGTVSYARTGKSRLAARRRA